MTSQRLFCPFVLLGRGFFFDGATFNAYPVNYPINPDCPWHDEEPCRVEAAASLTSDSSLADVCRPTRG
jgi:hypothetical protein